MTDNHKPLKTNKNITSFLRLSVCPCCPRTFIGFVCKHIKTGVFHDQYEEQISIKRGRQSFLMVQTIKTINYGVEIKIGAV